jgi:hypothetical protein
VTSGVSNLEPPSDLGADGRRAFVVAAEQIGGFADSERFYDAVVAFARAIDMLESVRRDWLAAGRPWVASYPNGAEAVHPLVKLIRDLESDAHRARKALKLEPDAIKRAGPGRPPGASSSTDRKAPPVIRVASK